MNEITLYTRPGSRGRIARWMLEEAGAVYRTEVLDVGESPEAFLHLNPMGKVPTIVHGDVVVTEAAAICLYLADVFPEAKLAPPPSARGLYYRNLLFAAGPLEAAMTNHMFGFEVPTELQQSVGYGSFARVLDSLEATLSQHRYAAGEFFSAADVYVGSQIGFGLEFGSIEPRPTFENYWQRLQARAAQRRASALDAELLPSS